MKFRTKAVIFLVAVLISLIGFNLIATSPALELMKAGKAAGSEVITHDRAQQTTAAHDPLSL